MGMGTAPGRGLGKGQLKAAVKATCRG
jgi:hypothetical protein